MSLSHWGIWPGWWTQGFVHGAYASTSIPVWKPVSFEEFCAVLDGPVTNGVLK